MTEIPPLMADGVPDEVPNAAIPARFQDLPKQVVEQARIAGRAGIAPNIGRMMRKFFGWIATEGLEFQALPADAAERFIATHDNPSSRNMIRKWLKDGTDVSARLYGAPFAHLQYGPNDKQLPRSQVTSFNVSKKNKKEVSVEAAEPQEAEPQVQQTGPMTLQLNVNAGKGTNQGKKPGPQPAPKMDTFTAGGLEFKGPFVRITLVSDGSNGLEPGVEAHLADVQTQRVVASGGMEEFLRRTYVKALRQKISNLSLGLTFRLYELNDRRLPTARVSELTVSSLDASAAFDTGQTSPAPAPSTPSPFNPAGMSPFVPGGMSPLGAPQSFAPVMLPPPAPEPVRDDAFRSHVTQENTELKRRLEEEGKSKDIELKKAQEAALSAQIEAKQKEYEMQVQNLAASQAQTLAELKADIARTQASGGNTATLERLVERLIESQTAKKGEPSFLEIMQMSQKENEIRLQREREERADRDRRDREERLEREKIEEKREERRREDERERQRAHEKFLADQSAKEQRDREERERRDREERERRDREHREQLAELKAQIAAKGSDKSEFERMIAMSQQARAYAESQGWTGGPAPSMGEMLIENAPSLLREFFGGLKDIKVGGVTAKPRPGALPTAAAEPQPQAESAFVLPEEAAAAIQTLASSKDDQALLDAFQSFFVSMYMAGGHAKARVERLGHAFAEADAYEDVFGVAKYLFRFADMPIGATGVPLEQVKLVAQVAHHNYTALYAMISGGTEKVLADAPALPVEPAEPVDPEDDEGDEDDEEDAEGDEGDDEGDAAPEPVQQVAGAPVEVEVPKPAVELAPAGPVTLSTQPRRRPRLA